MTDIDTRHQLTISCSYRNASDNTHNALKLPKRCALSLSYFNSAQRKCRSVAFNCEYLQKLIQNIYLTYSLKISAEYQCWLWKIRKTGFRKRKQVFPTFSNTQGLATEDILPGKSTRSAKYCTEADLPCYRCCATDLERQEYKVGLLSLRHKAAATTSGVYSNHPIPSAISTAFPWFGTLLISKDRICHSWKTLFTHSRLD